MADVLTEREPHLTKLAGDFIVVERANTCLQYVVKCLKDLEVKKVMQTSLEELSTVRK